MANGDGQSVDWLARAERELLAAELVLGVEPALSEIAAFHAAQAAAAALRGYLAAQGVEPPPGRGLQRLVDECYALDPEFAGLVEAAAALAPYYEGYLAPAGAAPGVSAAEKALELAGGVLRFVQDRLGDEGPSGSS